MCNQRKACESWLDAFNATTTTTSCFIHVQDDTPQNKNSNEKQRSTNAFIDYVIVLDEIYFDIYFKIVYLHMIYLYLL